MSKRETILQALAAKAALVSTVGGRVFRSREDALAASESPSIVIRPESEDVKEMNSGFVECFLTVSADVFQRASSGSSADSLADQTLQELHAQIMLDPTIGGLCIDTIDQSTMFDFDGGDETAAIITIRFQAWYRRGRSSLA